MWRTFSLSNAKINRKRPHIAEISCPIRKSGSRNRTMMSELYLEVYKWPFLRMPSENVAKNCPKCCALPGKTGNKKIAFFIRCISALREFNQSLLISSVFLAHDSYFALRYDSLNLVINAFSLGLLGCMVQMRGSRVRCSSWTVLHAQSVDFWISSFMVALCNRETIYIFMLWFVLLPSFFFLA